MNNKKIGWSSYETIEYYNPVNEMEAFMYDHYMACLKKYIDQNDPYAIKNFIAGRLGSPRKINILKKVISDNYPQYTALINYVLMLA
jgi:hypothetical protein